MTHDANGERARALRGIDAAAWAIRHVVQRYAIVGGEGAARLAVAFAHAEGVAERIPGDGIDAARAALGEAAAGRRVAIVVSGDALAACVPVLREFVRAAVPAVLVVPSHGAETGATLPSSSLDDVAHLAELPVGLLVAGDPAQVADMILAATRASVDRRAPWAVAFDLANVGLVLSPARLPTEEQVRAWTATLDAQSTGQGTPAPVVTAAHDDLARHQRDVERFGFAVNAAMRDLERTLRRPVSPLMAAGVSDADVILVATGPSGASARAAIASLHAKSGRHVGAVQIGEMRPLPTAEIVRLTWRARAVLVHEPWPSPLGSGGRLSDAVRAAFADALTWHPAYTGIGRIPPVVTVLGDSLDAAAWLSAVEQAMTPADPPRVIVPHVRAGGPGSPVLRIHLAVHEAERASALQIVVEWMAREGASVTAHSVEPDRTELVVPIAPDGRAPPVSDVMLVCPSGRYEPSRIETLPKGTLVVLVGEFSDRVLAETMRAASARGVRVAHLHPELPDERPDALATVALAAVVRAWVLPETASEGSLDAACRDSGVERASVWTAAVSAAGAALRAQGG